MALSFVAEGKGLISDPGDETPLEGADEVDTYVKMSRRENARLEVDYGYIKKEIADRSNQDSLGKLLVLLQVLRLVVQVAGRAAEGLPVTPMEFLTCGYVLWALGLYAMWWKKPYCIDAPIYLKLVERHSAADEDEASDAGGSDNDEKFEAIRSKSTSPLCSSFDRELIFVHSEQIICLLLIPFTAGFGAIHLAAWNTQFVNTHGQSLWQYCSLGQAAFPTLLLLFNACACPCCTRSPRTRRERRRREREKERDDYFMALSGFLLVSYYTIARVVLLLLVGLSFWALPVTAYEELDWLYFVPQWA